MENPLSIVKNSRKIYRKDLQKSIVEVQVELGEVKDWVRLDLFEALVNLNQKVKND